MIPERYAPQTYALMRIVFGFQFLCHGLQKFGMLGGINGQGGAAPFLGWPFGVAGFIEVVTGTLVLLGLLTRPAAFVASGQMAVAYFMVHFSAARPLPLQNMGEPAVLFCFGFLYIATRGSGIWSVDGARGRTRV